MAASPDTRKRRRKRRHRAKQFGALLVLALIITGIITAVVFIVHMKPDTDKVQGEIGGLGWVDIELLPLNEYSRPGTALKKINAVVIHYVGNAGTTAEQNHSYFTRLADSGETYASSNFIVGLDGEVLECVPVNEVAYCSNNRNGDTLSIECCHPDDTGEFTAATYASLVRLTAWLCEAFKLDATDLLRHYDITGKECPKYFVDHPDEWDGFKSNVQTALDTLKAEPKNS